MVKTSKKTYTDKFFEELADQLEERANNVIEYHDDELTPDLFAELIVDMGHMIHQTMKQARAAYKDKRLLYPDD